MDAMRKVLCVFVISLLFLSLTSSTTSHIYDEKLFSCINRVIRLVEWETTTQQKSNNFDIGFMGDQHLFNVTQNYFRGKTYNGKPIMVIHYLSSEQLEKNPPKVIYMGKHKHDLTKLNAVCNKKHIFSISDNQTYREDIPLVLLNVKDDIVDILVNKTEAEKQSFKLSYHLLRAAKEVK
jgi:hypothetical protein